MRNRHVEPSSAYTLPPGSMPLSRRLVGLRPERQALVHRDVADAELVRLFDEREARVVVEEEAPAVGSPLRIRLPGRDAMLLRKRVHRLEVARLVGIDAAVDEQPM